MASERDRKLFCFFGGVGGELYEASPEDLAKVICKSHEEKPGHG